MYFHMCPRIFVDWYAMSGMYFFVFFVFFSHGITAKKTRMYVAFQAKENPKNAYVYSFRGKETRLYIVLWQPRKQIYECIFPQNTENYRKMKKILRNCCTLKTELWVRSQTALCCHFCPPCFESYIWLLLKIWLLLLKILLRERSKLTWTGMWRRPKQHPLWNLQRTRRRQRQLTPLWIILRMTLPHVQSARQKARSMRWFRDRVFASSWGTFAVLAMLSRRNSSEKACSWRSFWAKSQWLHSSQNVRWRRRTRRMAGCCSRARAMLKKCMVQEVRREKRGGYAGEWQPLTYWELKGYDTERIKATCPMEEHSALGETYKVSIHTESDETLHAQAEQRITQMESDAQQRRLAAASAPGVPALELEEAMEAPAAASKGKRKGPLTEEEKQERKRLKTLAKQRETERKVATAAAAKLLPSLKTCLEKLETKLGGLDHDTLPPATLEQAVNAVELLTETIAGATKLLNAAATGKAGDAVDVDWKKEKDLQSRMKDGHAAHKALVDFARCQSAKPKGRSKKWDRSHACDPCRWSVMTLYPQLVCCHNSFSYIWSLAVGCDPLAPLRKNALSPFFGSNEQHLFHGKIYICI